MHTCFRVTDAYPHVDDATIDLDLDGPRATLIASGRLGPRSAAVLRTMLDALDAVPSPIHVRAGGAREVADEFVSALFEAQVRRRHLELPGLVLDDADGDADVLRAAVRNWHVPPEQASDGRLRTRRAKSPTALPLAVSDLATGPTR